MKRYVLITVILLIAVTLFSAVPFHAESSTDTATTGSSGSTSSGGTVNPPPPMPTVTLTLTADKQSMTPGETVTMNLTVPENSGIVSGVFTVVYDDTKFTYVSHQPGAILGTAGVVVEHKADAKSVVLTRTAAEGVVALKASGPLLTVAFTLKEGTEGQTLGASLTATDIKGAEGAAINALCDMKVSVKSVCKNHAFNSSKQTEANCIAPFTVTQHCQVCNSDIATTTGEPLGHQWGEWTVDSAATCTVPGKQTHKCSRSGCPAPTETQEIPVIPHTWDPNSTVTKAATCTEAGSENVVCTVCKTQGTQVIQPLGHSYDHVEEVAAATCIDPGYMRGICTRCGVLESILVPATGHNVESWQVRDDIKCGDAGIRSGTCKNCQATIEEYMDVMPHMFDIIETLIPPTETEFGRQKATCSRCGVVSEQLVPPLGMSTDTEPGYSFSSGTGGSDGGETSDVTDGPGGDGNDVLSGGGAGGSSSADGEVLKWSLISGVCGFVLGVLLSLVVFFLLRGKNRPDAPSPDPEGAAELRPEEVAPVAVPVTSEVRDDAPAQEPGTADESPNEEPPVLPDSVAVAVPSEASQPVDPEPASVDAPETAPDDPSEPASASEEPVNSVPTEAGKSEN